MQTATIGRCVSALKRASSVIEDVARRHGAARALDAEQEPLHLGVVPGALELRAEARDRALASAEPESPLLVLLREDAGEIDHEELRAGRASDDLLFELARAAEGQIERDAARAGEARQPEPQNGSAEPASALAPADSALRGASHPPDSRRH